MKEGVLLDFLLVLLMPVLGLPSVYWKHQAYMWALVYDQNLEGGGGGRGGGWGGG